MSDLAALQIVLGVLTGWLERRGATGDRSAPQLLRARRLMRSAELWNITGKR